MLNLKHNVSDEFKENIIKKLENRKNFMYYEGLRDGLEENIKYKFFYSNPFDPLEFIIIDIFYETVRTNIINRSIDAFGVIEIIKEKDSTPTGLTECIYGYIEAQDVVIRNVNKISIKLHLSKKGHMDISEAINYFENYACNREI